MTPFLYNENSLETTAIKTFQQIGYDYIDGQELKRELSQVVLRDRLQYALMRINRALSPAGVEEVVRNITNFSSQDIYADNRVISEWFSNGIDIAYREDGKIKNDIVKIFDSKIASNNNFLVVNQFTVIENNINRRPDIVVFINGLPIAVIELKNPIDEDADTQKAYTQLQNYKKSIPSIFRYNATLAVSDGIDARIGSLTAKWDRFMPWRGEDKTDPSQNKLDELISSLFAPQNIIDYIENFCLYESDGKNLIKKIAACHQFRVCRKAIENIVAATKSDRRGGIVWHTQGSGKSLSMVFLARLLSLEPRLHNPTLVVLTDRHHLDDQIFSTFGNAFNNKFLRHSPQQASSREDMKALLKRLAGGIIFTTIQKFDESFKTLSDRQNIIVMADEAHRSQYGFVDGFARYMRDALPNASYVAFTGTPIETKYKNTKAIFGDYIDIYDIKQAVADGATVPIYYESRLAKLGFDKSFLAEIDVAFDEITKDEDEYQKEKDSYKWAALEQMIGSASRLKLIAKDFIEHFRRRSETIDGKAMIVCMSRRICIDLYNEIVALAPDIEENIKIIMTGRSDDPEYFQPHIYSKQRRKELAEEFRKPESPFKIAIVCDMWLTGFDAPCLSTMYIDKPMQGHGLMQAIARVNRVYFNKRGGLIVDYIGLADHLKKALGDYTREGGKGKTAIDISEAIDIMMEKYEVVCAMFNGFDYIEVFNMKETEKLPFMTKMADFILGLEDGKKRFIQNVFELSAAFSLCATTEAAKSIRDSVGLFQGVKSIIAKLGSVENQSGKTGEEKETAIKQLISQAISGLGIVDIFREMGVDKPDVSILSDTFLEDVKKIEQRDLAAELLKKLIDNELKVKFRKNIVEMRRFSEILQNSFNRYQNRMIEAVEVIEELIKLAREIRESQTRGAKLGLNDDEIAFYDALGTNDSAVAVMGDKKLSLIAKMLTDKVRKNATIDWQMKLSVRAQLRIEVRELLDKYGYPPDKQEMAIDNVIVQAEVIAGGIEF